jgi:hypothetical protein
MVAVISGVAAFSVLAFDLGAHGQFRQVAQEPLGFIAIAAIISLLLYCGGVIMHSLLTPGRI